MGCFGAVSGADLVAIHFQELDTNTLIPGPCSKGVLLDRGFEAFRDAASLQIVMEGQLFPNLEAFLEILGLDMFKGLKTIYRHLDKCFEVIVQVGHAIHGVQVIGVLTARVREPAC